MASTSVQFKQDRRSLCQVGCEILTCPRQERTVRELNELSEEDRNVVWADLTGNARMAPHIDGMKDEEPDFVMTCLAELEAELSKLSSLSYETALQMDASFVNNPAFQLMFLRCEHYDAKLAAQRMAKYFEEKEMYFGREKLVKHITMEDLDQDDMDALFSGMMQLLPEKDHAGRSVIVFYKAFIEGYRFRENMLRTAWYMLHLAVADPEIQRKGVVIVVYNLGGFPEKGNDFEKSRRLAKLFQAIPVRLDAFLVCFDDAVWNGLVEAFSFMISRFLRVRFRPMNGSQQECFYKLMALGVPYYEIPVTKENVLKVDDHRQFLRRTRREAHQGFSKSSALLSGKRFRNPDPMVVEDETMDDQEDMYVAPRKKKESSLFSANLMQSQTRTPTSEASNPNDTKSGKSV